MDDPIPPRIAEKIDFTGICWEWTRGRTNGYGAVWFEGRVQYVHRVIWTLLVGPIPDGLTIDHLCRNHPCCNPDHLEPVTKRVNTLRGMNRLVLNATWARHRSRKSGQRPHDVGPLTG